MTDDELQKAIEMQRSTFGIADRYWAEGRVDDFAAAMEVSARLAIEIETELRSA